MDKRPLMYLKLRKFAVKFPLNVFQVKVNIEKEPQYRCRPQRLFIVTNIDG